MSKKGLLLVLSGPSGSGKDTILKEVAKRDSSIKLSVSLTTRPARIDEVDGYHYIFTSFDDFKQKIDNGEILEYAQYGANLYGTPKEPVEKWLNEGYTVILKIEVQGAEKIRALYPDVISVFLMPPSMEILAERLYKRETDDVDDIKMRMEIAEKEMARCKEYDYVVVNDVVDYAVNDINTILQAEKLKPSRILKKISEVIDNA